MDPAALEVGNIRRLLYAKAECCGTAASVLPTDLICKVLFMSCRCVFCYLYADECHERCVSHCDENIHFVTSFCWSIIFMTFAVLLSDINIPRNYINEKLIVMMIDINFLNI